MNKAGNRDITELYKKQISLTEWFENIKHSKTELLREEDNSKRDRLGVLNEIIGLPFDRPHQFDALDIANMTEDFKIFLEEHGDELCALRLIPVDSSLPKLRMRGYKIKEVINGWFKEQKIDYSKYKADFVPHLESYIWSSIFIVNSKGIFGEVIRGGHYQLTQGFHDEGEPISFSFDFNNWTFSKEDEEAKKHVNEIVSFLFVEDISKGRAIEQTLGGSFANNYLIGYFETVKSADKGVWFVDYNKTLVNMYKEVISVNDKVELISGQSASPGKVSGKVKIVNFENLGNIDFNNEILVCDVTTPDYFNFMQKSIGIITNRGGILSHASIVARELGKPCIVGTGNCTEVLKDGDLVEMDADIGVVKKGGF